MFSLRPKSSAHYLERPRLLELLPDSPGHVVWLEAPYGYGKSVLAAQWAERLEGQGWRVVWLAVQGGGLREVLARHLELPENAPWEVAREALATRPTLLVLEELETLAEPHELSPLLKAPPGLLLLASRGELAAPELPRLLTAGRLVHLRADALAFSEAEAAALFADPVRGRDARQRAQGWPLPLHFAALTGELPSRAALLEGVRESLAPAAWQEALWLAALPQLPREAAGEATRELAQSGFAQTLEGGYRLHPLIGDALLAAYPEAVREAVRAFASRLPPLLRGLAFERAGCAAELAELLEQYEAELERLDPEAVLRWDAALPPGGAGRDITVGSALCARGRVEAGLERLARVEAGLGASAEACLRALGERVWHLAERDPAEARGLVERGLSLLGRVSPERAGRFLSVASYPDYAAGDYPAAKAWVARALATFPPENPHRYGSLINLAILEWNLTGDLEGRIRLQEEGLAICRSHYPDHVAGGCRDLARLHLFLNQADVARDYLEEARSAAKPAPLIGLEAEAMLANLAGDPRPFAGLFSQAAPWRQAYVSDIIGGLWLRTLQQDDPARAANILAPQQLGGFGKLALALVWAELGERERALELLGEVDKAYPNREYTLHWQAAKYRLSRDGADLDRLLELTTAGERILPYFVPLAELPAERPELACAYPLDEVLASGWREAVAVRQGEIPPLELGVLGRFEARVLGDTADLTDRHKGLLGLLLLGHTREAIGEALWPEAGAKKVRNNLNVQLNLLRKVIEPWGTSTYLFEDGLRHTEADLWSLEAALEADDAERVYRLYREPLAPGVDLPLLDEAREVFRQRVIDLLFRAARGENLDYLERVLELEPVHEAALQHLLRQLVRRGRRGEAHRRYQAFALRLEKELGLSPLPETRALL